MSASTAPKAAKVPKPQSVPAITRSRSGPGEHAPLNEQELDSLQALMDSLPDTLEPLDTVMIDGYLCGVLLRGQALALLISRRNRWTFFSSRFTVAE